MIKLPETPCVGYVWMCVAVVVKNEKKTIGQLAFAVHPGKGRLVVVKPNVVGHGGLAGPARLKREGGVKSHSAAVTTTTKITTD